MVKTRPIQYKKNVIDPWINFIDWSRLCTLLEISVLNALVSSALPILFIFLNDENNNSSIKFSERLLVNSILIFSLLIDIKNLVIYLIKIIKIKEIKIPSNPRDLFRNAKSL